MEKQETNNEFGGSWLKDIVLIPEHSRANFNGRIYPEEILHQMVSELKGSVYQLPGTIGYLESPEIQLDKIAFMVRNLRVIDGSLIGDVDILNTFLGTTLHIMVESDSSVCVFRPAFIVENCEKLTGTETEPVVITPEMKPHLVYIAAIPTKDDAFGDKYQYESKSNCNGACGCDCGGTNV